MIEIVKEGKMPEYTAKCPHCSTELTYDRRDIFGSVTDSRDRVVRLGFVKCPLCDMNISLAVPKPEAIELAADIPEEELKNIEVEKATKLRSLLDMQEAHDTRRKHYEQDWGKATYTRPTSYWLALVILGFVGCIAGLIVAKLMN